MAEAVVTDRLPRLEGVRELCDEAVRARATARKVGRMKLKRPGESTYAIAIRDDADLWLALRIKRSSKSEFFIFHPTSDGNWNPHSSLHKDGTFRMKSHDKVMLDPAEEVARHCFNDAAPHVLVRIFRT